MTQNVDHVDRVRRSVEAGEKALAEGVPLPTLEEVVADAQAFVEGFVQRGGQ